MPMPHDLIAVDPAISHGALCFTGTRILVSDILELLAAGVGTDEITSSKYFPQLSVEHIHAALQYAADQFKLREFIPFSKS